MEARMSDSILSLSPTQELAQGIRYLYEARHASVFDVAAIGKLHRWVDVIARNNGNLSDEELKTTRDLVGVVSR